MKHIVYLTINTKNRKIYIGVHELKSDKFDYYIGNGLFTNKKLNNPTSPFQHAVKKYGVSAFERITLFECNTREEALEIEKAIVNEDFLKRRDVYNVALGGGLPPLLNKEICQYSLDGEFIKQWFSVEEASKAMGAAFAGCLSNAVYYKTVSFGYLWSHEKIEQLNLIDYKNTVQKIQVHVYNNERHYINSYDSLSEAARSLNIDNIKPITAAINTGKIYNDMYFSNIKYDILPFGKEFTNSCPVYQYDLNGKYLKTFKSRKDIKKELQEPTSGLSDAVYKSLPFLGFRWSLDKMELLNNLKELKITSLGKKIGQYTMEGELVKTFDTVRECRKDFGNVSKVLSGKVKHCKNFMFKYIEE